MSTLLEILQKTTAYLAGKGVANPKLNAELLLANTLKLRRLDLYLQFDRPMQTGELDALRTQVQRRGKREPLEYIIGNRPFADIELLCDRRALVPRSETEELVELLAARFATPRPARHTPQTKPLGAAQPATNTSDTQPPASPSPDFAAPTVSTIPTSVTATTATADASSIAATANAGASAATTTEPAQKPAPPHEVLDLGTGTGALALALAHIWPQANVTALDASTDALALARANAEHNDLCGRIRFVLANWFAPIDTAQYSTASSGTAPLSTAQPDTAPTNNITWHNTASPGIAQPGTAPAKHPAKDATAPELDGRTFDLIVSNPPYLTEAEWQVADPEVKDHEPYGALVAAEDGLADLRQILLAAPQFLAPGGLLALETGIAHHEALAQIAAATGAYAHTESHRDSDNRPRFFLAIAHG